MTLTRPTDFEALGERWRALEARTEVSFFQSWTWMGCLVTERFPDPVLLEATEAGQTVGLALCNHRPGFPRGRLAFGETGMAPFDDLFIEHNGPLVLAERRAAILQAMIAAAASRYDLILSGISGADRTALEAVCRIVPHRHLPAPLVDLASMRRDGGDYLARRAANTRQQIRRSDRVLSAAGDIAVTRAATEAEASAWLEDMAVLHQATWIARGRPGCFAQPFFGRFHHALIQRGMARAEIDLLRVSAGPHTIGVLYNFRHRGRVLAYQSGFDYAGGPRSAKPGMTSHHHAIRYYMTQAVDIYDFLAGDDRYKRSLADRDEGLHWLLAGPAWSPRVAAGRARAWVRRRVRPV